MSISNSEIAKILYEIGEYLAMQDIPFKPRAYEKVAVVIEGLEEEAQVIYKSGGLKISTNEKAECRYSFNRRFDFANATLMDGNELEHDAEWKSTTYYVQCSDQYGNKGGVMQIKAYEMY